MLTKIKAVFGKLILLSFFLFTMFTFLYFIIRKPIGINFPQRFNTLWWLLYIGLIITVSVGLIVFLNKLSLKTESINCKVTICGIIFVTVAPRILWISNISVTPLADFDTYQIFASSIANGKVTGNGYIALFPHCIGYPSFLAIFYKIFGNSTFVASILNIILSCGISLLLYKIGCKISCNSCGLFASLLWALWPSQIFYTVLVCTEYLYTFLLLLYTYFFIIVISKKRNLRLTISLFLLLGIVSAITNAIRPLALIVLTASIIYYIFFFGKSLSIKKIHVLIKVITVVFLILGYILTSQVITNTIGFLIDREVPKMPVGFNVYVGFNSNSSGSWNLEDSKTLTKVSTDPSIKPQQVHDELLQLAIKRIKGYSLKEMVELVVKKHGIMWVTDHDSIMYINAGFNKDLSNLDFYKYENLLTKLSNFYYYVVLFLCGIGVIPIINKKEQDKDIIIYFVLFVLGIIAVHMIVEVAGRYHFPVVSFFSLIAGYSITTICKNSSLKLFQKCHIKNQG